MKATLVTAGGRGHTLARMVSFGLWSALVLPSGAAEVDDLIALALQRHPALQAAAEGVNQSAATRQANREFLDPVTSASAGRLSGSSATPLLAAPGGLPYADAYGASAAVELPLEPGLYLGAGASQQYVTDPPAGTASGFYTLFGLQARVPLVRDRKFVSWHEGERRLAALQEAAEARLLEVRQEVRHAVESAYVDYLAALADAATAGQATERSRELLKEAQELVRLKVVPEYQLAPARLEVGLRLDEATSTLAAIDAARIRLAQVVGSPDCPPLSTNADALLLQSRVQHPATTPPPPATPRCGRGLLLEFTHLQDADAAEIRALEDQLRADVSLSLRGVWAADESAGGGANPSTGAGESPSYAAVVTWTRPWLQTGARNRLAATRAHARMLEAQRDEAGQRLAAEQRRAARDIAAARERSGELAEAVEQARITLEAEAERFRLGEGRSRNVLDAQNDLTKAIRLRHAAAAALLHGYCDLAFATGYTPEDVHGHE